MVLLARLSKFDTWMELEDAALHRYWDGLALLTAGEPQPTGAVYLLGYTFEMLMKTAYYRFNGLGPHDNTGDLLRGMADRAETFGFKWLGNRHNTESLANLLVGERHAQHRPLDPHFAAELTGHALAVSRDCWSEGLRYKSTIATEGEVADIFQRVEWLKLNYERLWS